MMMLFLTLPLLLAATTLGACDEGWEAYGDNCYYLETEKKGSNMGNEWYTWIDARAACVRMGGGDLATIHDEAENDFIASRLVAAALPATSWVTLWIGLRRVGVANTFEWVDGRDEQGYYENWGRFPGGGREPNNYGGSQDRACMVYNWYGGAGTWDDISKSGRQTFVCKKEAREEVDPPAFPRCEEELGWERVDGRCLLVSDERMDYFAGRLYGARKGGGDGLRLQCSPEPVPRGPGGRQRLHPDRSV